MKLGAEEKRKRLIAIVLGCCAGGAVIYTLYDQLGGSSSPPVIPQPVIVAAPANSISGPAAVKVATTSAQLDPTLHMQPMLVTESLVYTGTGRNIFSAVAEAPAVVLPKPIAPARVQTVTTTPPPPPQRQGPPPPPPINLKFFGTSTSQNGTRRAFLLNGDDVFVASIGDIVNRKYRVISIASNSVQVEDIPNSNKQNLPLLGP